MIYSLLKWIILFFEIAMSSVYNFKKIQVVPSSSDFIDIVLSKTQRKTPTVVHKHYQISRIRSFYMRKVKYTQENFDEKLSQILSDFPKLDVNTMIRVCFTLFRIFIRFMPIWWMSCTIAIITNLRLVRSTPRRIWSTMLVVITFACSSLVTLFIDASNWKKLLLVGMFLP